MKKLIAVLAVFALISGVAFAQVSGAVIGTAGILAASDKDGSEIVMGESGGMNRIRLEAAGSNDDETFGAWIRLDGESGAVGAQGYAWWKPIDQLKLTIGKFSDGFWGKEGYSGWMFYQAATDNGVTFGGENVWGWNLGPDQGGGFFSGARTRLAFFEGASSEGLFLEIKPVDMFGINIFLPATTLSADYEAAFAAAILQLDLNLDFGNIAVTMDGLSDAAKLFVYFGLSAIDNLNLDFGFSYDLGSEDAAVGLGLKVGLTDTIGLKFRTTAVLPKDEAIDLQLIADVMPIIAINDSMTFFCSLGLSVAAPKDGDAFINFHVNPFIQVGSEWGPSFFAGIKLWSEGGLDNGNINFSVPIAIGVSF